VSALLLEASGQVVLRLAALERSRQELMNFHAPKSGAVRDANTKRGPICHVQCAGQNGQPKDNPRQKLDVFIHAGKRASLASRCSTLALDDYNIVIRVAAEYNFENSGAWLTLKKSAGRHA
jgi:hypothetical protein